MDTLVGNVILTGVLVVALIIFVAASSGVAQLYTLRLERTLLGREAVYVAQSVQQLYLTVNSTQGFFPQSVVLDLPMPESLGGHAYTLSVAASTPAGTDEANLTFTVALSGSRLEASSSVVIGRCTVTSAAQLPYYPVLRVNLTLSLVNYQEACSMSFV